MRRKHGGGAHDHSSGAADTRTSIDAGLEARQFAARARNTALQRAVLRQVARYHRGEGLTSGEGVDEEAEQLAMDRAREQFAETAQRVRGRKVGESGVRGGQHSNGANLTTHITSQGGDEDVDPMTTPTARAAASEALKGRPMTLHTVVQAVQAAKMATRLELCTVVGT